MSENRTGLAAISLSKGASLTTDSVTWLPLQGLRAASASVPIAPWNTQGDGMYIVSVMSRVDPSVLLGWLDHGRQ
ncbi:hypothetical protein L1N85_17365 [Paenibacillus alkaliterrae]|uniref:hypothetical protein n=1 Tax=Paenibacillus alkaliterrae TaxID=320909 RepID=UPI001F19872F|nr:hypothetical protein [Paenibacillus alkaliterrae]MCF2940176.1 hypothetical protein [Paenibacillus alkaliterrae]